MALALVVAAFAGAGVGLVWQSSGFAEADDAGEEVAEEQDAPATGADAEAAGEGADQPGEGEGG